ncbi:hypothetical protein [Acidovorax lacteus]
MTPRPALMADHAALHRAAERHAQTLRRQALHAAWDAAGTALRAGVRWLQQTATRLRRPHAAASVCHARS